MIGAGDGDAGGCSRPPRRSAACLAEAGAVVVCGGRGGVMEAASRGAAEAGGVVIGVLPTIRPGRRERARHPRRRHRGRPRAQPRGRRLRRGRDRGRRRTGGRSRRSPSRASSASPWWRSQSWALRTAPATTSGSSRSRAPPTAVETALAAVGDAVSRVDTVRAFYEAINGGDVDGAVALLRRGRALARPPDVPITGTLEGSRGRAQDVAPPSRARWSASRSSRIAMEPDGERGARPGHVPRRAARWRPRLRVQRRPGLHRRATAASARVQEFRTRGRGRGRRCPIS